MLPQAFRIITPPLTNELILLVKDSSLAYILGLSAAGYELTKYGRDLSSTNANLTPLVIAGLCYLLITLPLTFVVQRMEARAREVGDRDVGQCHHSDGRGQGRRWSKSSTCISPLAPSRSAQRHLNGHPSR